MIHSARTHLLVNDEALDAVRVLVQDGHAGQALGVIEFAGLSIQSHAMSPRGLADGLREIAQQLDEKYDGWLRDRDIAPMPHLAQSEWRGGGVVTVNCPACGARWQVDDNGEPTPVYGNDEPVPSTPVYEQPGCNCELPMTVEWFRANPCPVHDLHEIEAAE